MKVLVTGGAGYIGSTICSALEERGHTPIVLDSLVTGRREFTRDRLFYEADVADASAIERIFLENAGIETTIHCAALVVVPDSVRRPYDYYRQNLATSIELFHNLERVGCTQLVFSSSASVYGAAPGLSLDEDSPVMPSSPYARTKYMTELVLEDFCLAHDMRGVALRYFNPIGADPKMRSGPQSEEPTQALARLVSEANGRVPYFEVTGTEWPTRDGTGIRDYVHVWDVAQAHVNAVEGFSEVFARSQDPDHPYLVLNLGSGRGVTVRELVESFERVVGRSIDKRDAPPRPGDVAGAYASIELANKLLDWEPVLTVDQAIADALRWAELRDSVLGT